MIEHQQEKYGWEFLFLGANMDAISEASKLGIRQDRAVRYECDEVGTALNYECVCDTITDIRMGKAMSGNWKRRIDDYRKTKKS